jgi:hypothetical protein
MSIFAAAAETAIAAADASMTFAPLKPKRARRQSDSALLVTV